MRELMNAAKERIEYVVGSTCALALIGAAAFCFISFMQALQPASPAITLIVVIIATIGAMSKGKLNGLLALAGIALYLASWSVKDSYGVWQSLTVWSAGMLLWFSALFFRFRLWPPAMSL